MISIVDFVFLQLNIQTITLSPPPKTLVGYLICDIVIGMTAWQAVVTVGRLLDSDRTVIKAGGGEIPPQNWFSF